MNEGVGVNSPQYSAVFYFLGRYKLLTGSILALILTSSVLESLSVAAFLPVFSSLLGSSDQRMGGPLGFVEEMTDLMPSSDPIVAASALLIGLFIAKTLLSVAMEALIAYTSGKVLYTVQSDIVDRYASGQYQFFLDNRQGTLLYNSLTAPTAVGLLLLRGPQMTAFFMKLAAVAVILGLIFPMGFLAFVCLGLLYYLLIHHLSRTVSFNLGRRRAAAGAEQNVIANELISGIRQIIAFGVAGQWASRFDRQSRDHAEAHGWLMGWLAMPRPLMELSAVLLMLGFILAIRAFSPGDLVDLLPKLGVFAMALVHMLPALTSFGRLRMEVMGLLPDVDRAYHTIISLVPKRAEGTVDLDRLQQGIAFENVSFAHQGREPLMKGVDLVFEKGRVTAVVGPSGAGKTTVINLVLGLFQPDRGRITVDGVPLGEVRQSTWLGRIGLVSQDPFISSSSVVDNIVFGRNGHSTESVIQAAKTANAHGFVSELPQGYDTVIGDRGMKLSGGQQQRLAIARAVLSSPEILIFDEATSSLDTASERLVQEAIYSVSRDRTVIIIAHRLSTIRYADKIVVLDHGEVIEEGSHEELLERQGHYSRLVASST